MVWEAIDKVGHDGMQMCHGVDMNFWVRFLEVGEVGIVDSAGWPCIQVLQQHSLVVDIRRRGKDAVDNGIVAHKLLPLHKGQCSDTALGIGNVDLF
eukprot:709389-Ditylum_brightwellii.AAC.2